MCDITPSRGLIVGLVMLSLTLPASGQEVPEASVGERVRIVIASPGAATVLSGRVLALSTDSILVTIHPGAAPLHMSWSAIARLDVSRGRRYTVGNVLRNSAEGATAMGVGVLLLELFRDDPGWLAPLIGVGVGAVAGAWAGLYPEEIWARVR